MKQAPINQIFNSLTVLSLDRMEKKNGYFVLAQCKCGSIKIYRLNYLENNHTKSCGCMRGEKNIERSTHGHTPRGNINKTYSVYRDMRTRCENKKYKQFYLYGGRGIEVCHKWKQGYEFFLKDMGEKPYGMSIERKNVNENYSPENCIWATDETQANNKRNSVKIEYCGKIQTVAQWSRELNIKAGAIYFRISKGLSGKEALFSKDKS